MSNYPSRCQHLKVNGTQCGSPALRRNRFCFFHKRFQDETIRLAADRKRRPATFVLPVLEDANSVQVALMQIMRLLAAQQIDPKIASLLLYALQTASTNLRHTNFRPYKYEVILDPRDASESLLDQNLWDAKDFEEEEEEEAAPKKPYDPLDRLREKARLRQIESQRKEKETEEYLVKWIKTHPHHRLINVEGQVRLEQIPREERQPVPATPEPKKPAATPEPAKPATNPEPKKPATAVFKEAEFKSDIRALAQKHFLPNMPPEVARELNKTMDKKGT